MAAEVNAGGAGAEAGIYLVFALGETDYAVPVSRVREIIGLLPITRVPCVPDAVRGMINLRGKVIPVIDLRVRFGLTAVDHGQRTCIIVLQAAGAELGVVVDRVIEVARIAEGEIEEAPRFAADVDTAYLQGVVKSGSAVRLLLDLDRTLARAELSALATLAAT